MARAVLQRNKILLMDEGLFYQDGFTFFDHKLNCFRAATSSVDYECVFHRKR